MERCENGIVQLLCKFDMNHFLVPAFLALAFHFMLLSAAHSEERILMLTDLQQEDDNDGDERTVLYDSEDLQNLSDSGDEHRIDSEAPTVPYEERYAREFGDAQITLRRRLRIKTPQGLAAAAAAASTIAVAAEAAESAEGN